MTKMPQKYQMTKKKKNLQNDQNTHKTTKMIKKYSWNHQSDQNTPKMTKITSVP